VYESRPRSRLQPDVPPLWMCHLFGCTELVGNRTSSGFFLAGWPITVGVNTMYLFVIPTLIVIVSRWP
jgi:hypothetical protein